MGTHTRIIKDEAHFQDKRIISDFKEPRSKFSLVIEPTTQNYYNKINRILESSSLEVLVVGCSTGTVTPLARKGANVIGIDISKEAIAHLNYAIQKEGLSTNATAIVMDAEKPEFPENSFDLICCSGVLHHLDINRSLNNWHKLLKTNGRIVMLEPLKWNPFAAIYRHFTPAERTPNEHPLSRSDIIMIKKYFYNTWLTPINLFTPLSLLFTFYLNLPRIAKVSYIFFSMIDKFLFKCIPVLKYFSWSMIIECTKSNK